MKVFLLSLGILLCPAVFAQNSWKVLLNDKTILSASTENEEKNRIALKPSDLKKKKDFVVTYTEKKAKDDWERVITAYNEKDKELTRQKGSKLKIKNALLLSWLKQHQQIRIYTWALPTDPKLKASIRVRRVHLCTLVLE